MDFAISALRAAYQAGLDPGDVVADCYERLERVKDPGIFISLVPREKALAAAGALGTRDPAKPLWGIPFAVKDNIDASGLPTTAACPAFAYSPEADSFAVAKLLAAGAILIGKTNLDQFATGLVGTRTPYPVPRNSFSKEIPPGGSSSGSAVAVAHEIVSFALGTDTAGSGRVPAALNNIVGLKPSVGAISMRGVVPACRSLDCISVFAQSVDDAWAVYRVMGVEDIADPFQRALSLDASPRTPPGLCRIGIPRPTDLEFFGDTQAESAWSGTLSGLSAMGASLIEVDMQPFLAVAALLYDGPWVAERHAATKEFLARDAEMMLPLTRGIIEVAHRFSATDAFEGRYRLAELAHLTKPVWAKVDAIALPSIPCVPTLSELAADPLGVNARLGRWTNFVNLLDLCALAVPGDMRSDGLPSGMTLVAPRGEDARIAGLGRAFHHQFGRTVGATEKLLAPMQPQSQTDSGLIELVVIGAHLSGMALNRELTSIGGQFLRAVDTSPCYQFYRLAGGPPFRPGLLRVAEGEGVAIATEVWGLSPEAFGRFVAGIPAPLGIGTLLLSDGTRPKGFLVEPEGLAGAQNISGFGGWRAYVASLAPG